MTFYRMTALFLIAAACAAMLVGLFWCTESSAKIAAMLFSVGLSLTALLAISNIEE